MTQSDNNLIKYESAKVVEFYARQAELQPAEVYLFARYLPNDVDILDIGVGGGRTTPYLAARARRYVGADYAQAMVDACRARFPEQEFTYCDATDMADFADASFDVVVFSFNGIDVIRSDEGRAACLSETARILRPGGLFFFSSHNARVLGIIPNFKGANVVQRAWRILRASGKSAKLCARALFGTAYRAGEGYIRDADMGGMDYYTSTPGAVVPQLDRVGLEVIEYVAGPDSSIRLEAFTSWHYYACRKQG